MATVVDGLAIRPYRPGDEAAINDGFNAVFGLSRSLDEWRWKFASDPCNVCIMLAAGPDGEVAAHYGALVSRFKTGDLVVRAGQPVDVYSRPHVRRGLAAARVYLRTVESFFSHFGAPDKLALLFGFPGERALKLGVAKLGYAEMEPEPVRYWVKRPEGRRILPTMHRVRSGFDESGVDDVWQRAKDRYYAAVVRDGARLRRRYTARPGVEYLHLAVWHGRQISAWGVLRTEGRNTWLADLIWDGERAGAIDALDRAIVAVARQKGADQIVAWLNGDHEAEALLRHFGWRQVPHPDRLVTVARSFHPGIDVAALRGRLYLTAGDSDLV